MAADTEQNVTALACCLHTHWHARTRTHKGARDNLPGVWIAAVKLCKRRRTCKQDGAVYFNIFTTLSVAFTRGSTVFRSATPKEGKQGRSHDYVKNLSCTETTKKIHELIFDKSLTDTQEPLSTAETMGGVTERRARKAGTRKGKQRNEALRRGLHTLQFKDSLAFCLNVMQSACGRRLGMGGTSNPRQLPTPREICIRVGRALRYSSNTHTRWQGGDGRDIKGSMSRTWSTWVDCFNGSSGQLRPPWSSKRLSLLGRKIL